MALLTAMDRPLGRACGNALETEEALAALRGEGPADLLEVTYALSVEMLLLARVEQNRGAARERLERAIASGEAADKFREVVTAQGGNPAVLDDPAVLPQAPVESVYAAQGAGHVARVEPRRIGKAIVEMGGGRRTMEDEIDHRVGFVVSAKPGDPVERGQPLATIFGRDEASLALGARALREAITIVEAKPPPPLPLVSHRITRGGVELIA